MFTDTPLSSWEVLSTSVLVCTGWTLAKGVYNLYFHPLAGFPGPRWAAFSPWWKTNLEAFQGRNLTEELFKLHEIYGDVVRIGPNELHFSKPSVYHEIYSPKNRWSRDPSLYHVFASYENLLSKMEYAKAKQRKDVLQPLFSRKAILNLQHLVQECANEMCANIEQHIKEGRSINFFKAYQCFALDGITSFCFGTSMHATSEPGFDALILQAMHASLSIMQPLKHFILLKKAVRAIPENIASVLDPTLKGLAKLLTMLRDQVEEILAHPEVLESAPHPTIFHELVSGENGRQIPPKLELEDEAFLMVFAGTDTSSSTLAVATVYILQNPQVHARLKEELLKVWPNLQDIPRYEDLESLPYLKAVLKESLRLIHGVFSPMTRIVPKGGAEIDGRYVPGGAIVGISNMFVHLNPEIFPDPYTFKPERWLETKTDGNDSLDHWLVAFSKGPRSCLGINLGWCEITLAVANVFRRFDLELDGVTPSDLTWKECYIPHYNGPDLKLIARPRTA
ncbi:cytochrome P450 [Irpex rosettiformis]|uniref:Cytochrome P450 n=1 Tax=Irpex rosettiformis TaxID=378272 RepID=A0ACB8TRM2_9APHY|nr:cytochrome P450 [Irpex rosettiformis]